MKRRAKAAGVARLGVSIAAVTLVLGACTSESATNLATPSATPVHRLAAEGTCTEVLDYPELPVWELNATLPVDGVDVAYTQEELAVERSDAGACNSELPVPVEPECALLDAPVDEGRNIVLWRPAEAVSDVLFSEGAVTGIYENVTGRTKDGGTFRYRMNAWTFGNEGEAAKASIFDVVRACKPDVDTRDGVDYLALSDGGENYLVAFHVENRAYLVETRIGRSDEGDPEVIKGSATGALPSEAVDMIADWWLKEAASAA